MPTCLHPTLITAAWWIKGYSRHQGTRGSGLPARVAHHCLQPPAGGAGAAAHPGLCTDNQQQQQQQDPSWACQLPLRLI
jgi:hypothetical protein